MAVTGITLRNVKGSELTFTEMDNNFDNLKTAIEALQTGTSVTVDTDQTITGAKSFTGAVSVKALNETVYDYGAASGTITPDAANGTVQKLTLTGNITINEVTNVVTGSSVTLILTQDGTGGRTFASTAKFPGAFKTLSTSSGATDIITLFYDGGEYWGNIARGFA